MNSSLRLEGIFLADERYRKMLAIFDQCKELDVRVPDEVLEFFDYKSNPDPMGHTISLITMRNDSGVRLVTEFTGGTSSEGLEINVDDIPENIKVLRFYCTY